MCWFIIFSQLVWAHCNARRLRKYIGPQSYCNWPDVEARQKMEKAVKDIQAKADQIYNKFKSNFAFQVMLNNPLTLWHELSRRVTRHFGSSLSLKCRSSKRKQQAWRSPRWYILPSNKILTHFVLTGAEFDQRPNETTQQLEPPLWWWRLVERNGEHLPPTVQISLKKS